MFMFLCFLKYFKGLFQPSQSKFKPVLLRWDTTHGNSTVSFFWLIVLLVFFFILEVHMLVFFFLCPSDIHVFYLVDFSLLKKEKKKKKLAEHMLQNLCQMYEIVKSRNRVKEAILLTVETAKSILKETSHSVATGFCLSILTPRLSVL